MDLIVESVREKLLTRSEAGIKKYGTDMTRKDLSELDWLRHAQEEAMDLAVYLERLIQDKINGWLPAPQAAEETPGVWRSRGMKWFKKLFGKKQIPRAEETWIMSYEDGSPWPKEPGPRVKVQDVKSGWVLYSIGSMFNDERATLKTFMTLYRKVD